MKDEIYLKFSMTMVLVKVWSGLVRVMTLELAVVVATVVAKDVVATLSMMSSSLSSAGLPSATTAAVCRLLFCCPEASWTSTTPVEVWNA